jgi:hypothetical protein
MSNGGIGRIKAAQVVARDGYACRYCGCVLHGTLIPGTHGPRLSIDHIKPRSRGGSDHPTNLAAGLDLRLYEGTHCG